MVQAERRQHYDGYTFTAGMHMQRHEPSQAFTWSRTLISICRCRAWHVRHGDAVPGPVHNERVTGRIRYPFEPKSIARLRAGQFWAVPLSDGRHACGRVLHVPGKADSLYLNSRIFLAGLMDWSGSGPPTSEAIAGCGILAQGSMHVVAIRDTGSLIIGQRDLELDGITGLQEISHRAGGTVWLYEGGLRLRPATAEERRTMPVMSGWGRRFIQILAEKHFVHH
jgi:hypothetical protein